MCMVTDIEPEEGGGAVEGRGWSLIDLVSGRVREGTGGGQRSLWECNSLWGSTGNRECDDPS